MQPPSSWKIKLKKHPQQSADNQLKTNPCFKCGTAHNKKRKSKNVYCKKCQKKLKPTRNFDFKDMTHFQMKSKQIPWIFLRRSTGSSSTGSSSTGSSSTGSNTGNGTGSYNYFQVSVGALWGLDIDKQSNIGCENLLCFLNQIQFIRLKCLQMYQIRNSTPGMYNEDDDWSGVDRPHEWQLHDHWRLNPKMNISKNISLFHPL